MQINAACSGILDSKFKKILRRKSLIFSKDFMFFEDQGKNKKKWNHWNDSDITDFGKIILQ